MAALMSAGLIIGSTTLKSVCTVERPSTSAASSYPSGFSRKFLKELKIIHGVA